MRSRSPGLQEKWAHVVNSLQRITPSYEVASSRISLFSDKRMRAEAVGFAVRVGDLVLDLGSGPGTMSKLIEAGGGEPVLLDVSGVMLSASAFKNRVRGTFEHLPFRPGVFDGVVSGFALRDALDLREAISGVAAVIKKEGRFGFCDLGKPDSAFATFALGVYVRTVPGLVGLLTAGRAGLGYGSLFDTYVLVLHNSELREALRRFFRVVEVHETQMGGSIVVKCTK